MTSNEMKKIRQKIVEAMGDETEEKLSIESALKKAKGEGWSIDEVEDAISEAYDMISGEDFSSSNGNYLIDAIIDTAKDMDGEDLNSGAIDDLIYPTVDELWNDE